MRIFQKITGIKTQGKDLFSILKKPLAHSAIYISGTLISGMVSLITFPILARLISIEDMGKYDFFMFMLLTATPFITFGVQTGLGAIAHEYDIEELNYLLKKIIPISIMFAVTISFGVFIFKSFNIFQTFSFYLIGLWTFALISLAFCSIMRPLFIWKQYPVKAAILINGEWIAASIIGISLILFTKIHKIEVYLTGLTIAFVIFSALSYIFWPSHESKKASISLKALLKLSWPYGITQALFVLSLGIEKTVILKMLGPHSLGIYAMATKIGSIPRLIGTGFLFGIVPELIKKDNRQYHTTLRLLFIIISLYVILSTLSFNIAKKMIIGLFGGSKYNASIGILPIATFAETINLIPWAINSILLKSKNTFPILYYAITANILTVLIGLIIIPSANITGAIWASIAGKTIGIIILAKIIYKNQMKG